MLQLRAEGVYIDLYDTDPIKLNLSLEDLENFSPQSTFTRSFRVPNTNNNSSFFNTAFEINGYDFDVTIKKEAVLLVGSNEFKYGHIRLNKIYHSNESRNIDYEIVFYGEVRDFASLTGFLNEIDLSDYNHILSYNNVVLSWQAYPENGLSGLNDGLLNGDVVYPLVDFGNTYNDAGATLQTRIALNHPSSDGGSIDQQNHPLTIDRFKPVIRAKVIWDKIFEEVGYTYESTFLNSNLFRHMYVTAWGNSTDISITTTDNLVHAQCDYPDTTTGDLLPIVFDTEIYDYGNNFNGEVYTAPLPGGNNYKYKYVVDTDFRGQTTGLGNGTLTFKVYRKQNFLGGTTTLLYSDTVTVLENTEGYYTFNTGELTVNLDSTDSEILYAELDQSNVLDYSLIGDFFILEAPGEMDVQYYMDDKYKKIDFIKDVITKFKLVLAPHPTTKNKFIIEPWSEYVGSGEVKDWTNKLDLSKDFVIEPLFFKQSDELEFKDKLGGDYLNTINIENFEEIYGTLKFDSNNDLLKGTKDITTQLGATPVTQIEGANTGNDGNINMILPQIHAHEAEDTGVQHRPIRPATRLLFYDGLITLGYNAANTGSWWVDNGGLSVEYTEYPMISTWNEWPVDTQTLNLSWQKEQGYIKNPELVGYDVLLGESVFDRYWARYINILYNKWSRKVTAYFYLTNDDIINFKFSDVIFLKGNYFYVNKITDAILNDNAVTKVELIKLLDYSPDPNNFLPPGNIWNEFDEVWNTTTATWND